MVLILVPPTPFLSMDNKEVLVLTIVPLARPFKLPESAQTKGNLGAFICNKTLLPPVS